MKYHCRASLVKIPTIIMDQPLPELYMLRRRPMFSLRKMFSMDSENIEWMSHPPYHEGSVVANDELTVCYGDCIRMSAIMIFVFWREIIVLAADDSLLTTVVRLDSLTKQLDRSFNVNKNIHAAKNEASYIISDTRMDKIASK